MTVLKRSVEGCESNGVLIERQNWTFDVTEDNVVEERRRYSQIRHAGINLSRSTAWSELFETWLHLVVTKKNLPLISLYRYLSCSHNERLRV